MKLKRRDILLYYRIKFVLCEEENIYPMKFRTKEDINSFLKEVFSDRSVIPILFKRKEILIFQESALLDTEGNPVLIEENDHEFY